MIELAVFVLSYSNPANSLALAFEQEPVEGRDWIAPWRLEVAAALVERWLEFEPRREATQALLGWATGEALNRGSFFRFDCPVVLRGSGRWFAADEGGHYALLRRECVKWLALPEEERQAYTNFARVWITPRSAPRLIKFWRSEAERIRQLRAGIKAASAIAAFFRYCLAEPSPTYFAEGMPPRPATLRVAGCLRCKIGDYPPGIDYCAPGRAFDEGTCSGVCPLYGEALVMRDEHGGCWPREGDWGDEDARDRARKALHQILLY